MTNKHKIFADLEKFAELLPVNLYWLDINGEFMGGNDLCLPNSGAKSWNEWLGKTYNDVQPPELAKPIVENVKRVITTGKLIICEDKYQDLTTGEIRYYKAIRTPLRDDNGQIIGIIGTSVEISAEKEAEQLKIENARLALENVQMELEQQQAKAEEQARFNVSDPGNTSF